MEKFKTWNNQTKIKSNTPPQKKNKKVKQKNLKE